MVHAAALVFALGFAGAPASTHAECFIQTASFVTAERSIELVFSGKVVALTLVRDGHVRATLEVSRVWKGSVSERFDLYVWALDPEVPQFTSGQRYVVLARRLTDQRARRDLDLPAGLRVFTPTQCSGVLSPDIERDLGPGYAPAKDK